MTPMEPYWQDGEEVTHSVLVRIAQRWLARTVRCEVVRAESAAWICQEIPDAIGWKLHSYGAVSYLIECKMSMSDFCADKNKTSRLLGGGVGMRRFYLCPPGVIQLDSVPQEWGLLYANQRRVLKVRDARQREATVGQLQTEMLFLGSLLRWRIDRFVTGHCMEREKR